MFKLILLGWERIIILDKLHYPRPQFVRENWIDLNGEWKFAFDDENELSYLSGREFQARDIKLLDDYKERKF